jgi:hypothetical protein
MLNMRWGNVDFDNKLIILFPEQTKKQEKTQSTKVTTSCKNIMFREGIKVVLF